MNDELTPLDGKKAGKGIFQMPTSGHTPQNLAERSMPILLEGHTSATADLHLNQDTGAAQWLDMEALRDQTKHRAHHSLTLWHLMWHTVTFVLCGTQ